MESYCIVNKQVLHFAGKGPGVGFRRLSANAVKAKFPQNFPFKMTSHSVPFVGQENTKKTIAYVKVEILITKLTDNGTAPNSMITLKTSAENPVFKGIWTTFPSGRVSLTWYVTDFGEVGIQDAPDAESHKIELKCEGVQVNPDPQINFNTNSTMSTNHGEFNLKGGMKVISAQTVDRWRKGKKFQGTLSVFLVILETPYELVVQNDYFAKMRKMLDENKDKDLELVTRENKDTVKCHKAVLSVCSGQLEKLLNRQPNMLVVEIMRHLSFECINAFLAYIYYNDVSKILSSTEMAVQVLEPALDFGIKSLLSRIEAYFILKPNHELTANQVVRIFVMIKSSKLREFGNRAIYFGDYGDFVGGHIGRVDDKRIINSEYDQIEDRRRKRICTEERARFSGGSQSLDRQGQSSNIGNGSIRSNGNSSGPSSGSETYTMRSDMNGEDKNYLDGLERKVIQLINWHRENNALMDSDEFKKLINHPEVLMDICTLFGRN